MSCDPARQAQQDQRVAALTEMWAAIAWGTYVQGITKGFSVKQALDVAIEAMVAFMHRPYDCPPAQPEEDD